MVVHQSAEAAGPSGPPLKPWSMDINIEGQVMVDLWELYRRVSHMEMSSFGISIARAGDIDLRSVGGFFVVVLVFFFLFVILCFFWEIRADVLTTGAHFGAPAQLWGGLFV